MSLVADLSEAQIAEAREVRSMVDLIYHICIYPTAHFNPLHDVSNVLYLGLSFWVRLLLVALLQREHVRGS